MKKRMAVLFFGKHYGENYHWTDNIYLVDWKKSVNNYKHFIFDFFSKDYDIDCFAGTYETPQFKEVNRDYNFKGYIFAKPVASRMLSRHSCVINAFKAMFESEIVYDMVLVTRFDLHFTMPFEKVKIYDDRLNLVSMLERKNLICDNLYIFPFFLAQKIFDVFEKEGPTKSYHYLQEQLQAISPINYLYNEEVLVEHLSFYKIVRSIHIRSRINFGMRRKQFK